jgi:hypothetical protein
MKHTQFLKLGMGFVIALSVLPWQGGQGREDSKVKEKNTLATLASNKDVHIQKTEERLKQTLSKHIYTNASFAN